MSQVVRSAFPGSTVGARGKRRQARILGIAFSLAVHVVIMTGLALGLRSALAPVPRAIQVSFVSIDVLRPKAPTRKPPRPAQPPRALAIHQTAAPPSAPAPILVPPAPPSPAHGPAAAPAAPGVSNDVREALRGSLGCDNADFYQLSPAERAKCRDHDIALGKAAPDVPLASGESPAEAALRRYRGTTRMDDYPGVRCVFLGGNCPSGPPAPAPEPPPISQGRQDKGLE